MEKPVVAGKRSLKLEMEAGTYLYCTCGRTKNQPFCDKAHKGSGFKPEIVVIREKRLVKWCMCRHSQKGYWCDNSHRQLEGYVAKKED